MDNLPELALYNGFKYVRYLYTVILRYLKIPNTHAIMTCINCQPHLSSPSPNSRRWVRIVFLFLLLCGDQITKYAARNILLPEKEFSFFEGLIKFSLAENHGGFLGIVSNLPSELRFLFLNILVALLLCASLVYLLRFPQKNSHIWVPLTMITGGGLGNLLDRLLGNGGVTDFIIVGMAGIAQTGIFNLADVFILTGSFALGFQLFRHAADDQR